MSKWKEYNLNEVYDFTSGLSKGASEFGFGHGFLGFTDIFKNFFVPNELTSLVNSTEKEQQSCSIKRGDVFLTRTSETDEDLGMSCVALKDYPNATFNGFTKRLRPKGNVEILPEYAGFYFRSPKFRATVSGMSSITTRASLNNGMLAQLTISVPEIEEQSAIADALFSLLKKVELLKRQNETLENLGITLFRKWFVVDAKEDWETGKLGDNVNIVYGKNLPTKNLLSQGYPVFGGNGQIGFFNEYLYEEPQVLVSCRGEASGTVNITHSKSFVTNNSLVLKLSKNKNISFEYLKYFSLHTDYKVYATGSAQPQITIEVLNDAEILLPNTELINGFTRIVKDWELKRTNNTKQIIDLEKMSNTLLPKLMNKEATIEI
ncbi:restriction endonuclease subunit S [Chryseobacterium gotjawalense]|uniref:Restriction endonuclease subunit S n=1 Tax=Chryseobacterium gotjawalense TaxID=3042315 RepID=A0ABY8RF58_9FLAO|nr:restriction endonuclease subunit S [Chryseobacterium sp. wdc7]WHF51882.1 restriction endonuclease subunit S [Chryseobacterium sp. wdc7]